MRFALAPMSAMFVALTTLVYAIGFALLVAGGMFDFRPLLFGALLVFAVCELTRLTMRPTGFEVGPQGLVTVFRTRRKLVPAKAIASARVIDAKTLRREIGVSLRIGVGGLYGTFGWLWTARRGIVSCWISRTDGMVWIERRGAGPLVITPERPAELVAKLVRA